MAERATGETQRRRTEGEEPTQEYPVARKVGHTAVNDSAETQVPDILDTIDEVLATEQISADAMGRLLDEIDAVLEENPEMLVALYRQRGGE